MPPFLAADFSTTVYSRPFWRNEYPRNAADSYEGFFDGGSSKRTAEEAIEEAAEAEGAGEGEGTASRAIRRPEGGSVSSDIEEALMLTLQLIFAEETVPLALTAEE
jgi:hypothetical protein